MTMAERELVPTEEDALWKRIAAWLRDGRTGQIVLNVQDGEIRSFQLSEYGKVRPGKGLSSR